MSRWKKWQYVGAACLVELVMNITGTNGVRTRTSVKEWPTTFDLSLICGGWDAHIQLGNSGEGQESPYEIVNHGTDETYVKCNALLIARPHSGQQVAHDNGRDSILIGAFVLYVVKWTGVTAAYYIQRGYVSRTKTLSDNNKYHEEVNILSLDGVLLLSRSNKWPECGRGNTLPTLPWYEKT